MKKNGLFIKIFTVILLLGLSVMGNISMYSKAEYADTDIDFKEYAEQVIVLVNEARIAEGLNPVYAVPYLCELSEIRAEECVYNFSHSRINGDSFVSIIDYDLAPWMSAAENIASGMNTPEATFEQWRNSPSHWSAIMNPEYTHMGVGVTYNEDSVYKWYWQQLFIKVDTFENSDGYIDGQYIPDKYKIIPKTAGDVTGDGIVDSFDFILICQYINKQITLNPLQVESADVLKDGVITYSDAYYLRKYILGEVSQLPVRLF